MTPLPKVLAIKPLGLAGAIAAVMASLAAVFVRAQPYSADQPPSLVVCLHNVGPLAERLLAGNAMRYYVANLYSYLSYNTASIAPLDRYLSLDCLRAGHAW